jgi:hypothetical protein
LRKYPVWFAGLVFLMTIPCLAQSQRPEGTELRGYVFEKDGTSPVEQATVYIKELPDGDVMASAPTDKDGLFEIAGISKGIYVFGVKTPRGNFNTGKLLGIGAQSGEYARMYVSLVPFSGTEGSESFLAVLPDPVGRVTVLAGNEAIVVGAVEIDDEPVEAGPFREKSR